MNDEFSIAAVICAAGSSSRMKGVKKEYRTLDALDDEGNPLTVLGAVVTAFAASFRINTIVITVPIAPEHGECNARKALPSQFLQASGKPDKPQLLFVPGGSSRRISVHHALSLLVAFHPNYVLIHDGARPWIDADLIERTIDAVLTHKAVIPVLPLIETPKEIGDTGGVHGVQTVTRHLRRAYIVTAQTPQAFAFPAILYAHEKAAVRESQDGIDYTDDAEVWGEFCGPVTVIRGSPDNKKITFPHDLK
ncbi:MAG: 2-C-methyl-D-erythritol 4-phosphate cytidylyltransferase [Treponema sp.]|jgi:2-C-methyl-D-erythritol 4-phosphate cytidylyltransferase/2-C-methyl-D-erythritol 4-phosphate cytidylyltransferase/2-C-methyl-D-erythritol 2,4-cyclodiphosphate synthase|nr:2-C-methyl-D-erythritol 4-phosphate cytidylyltransferase [Treponema sp.]